MELRFIPGGETVMANFVMWSTLATDDVITKRINTWNISYKNTRNISSSLSINVYNTLDTFVHALKKFSAALSSLWAYRIMH